MNATSPVLGLALALGVSAGCTEIQPPNVTPTSVTITKVTAESAEIEASVEATNPNKVELTANTVASKVTIGGKPGVANAMVTSSLVLPALQKAPAKIPLRIVWVDKAALGALAEAKTTAPYEVEGTVDFVAAGGGKSVRTVFVVKGTMSAEDLGRAAGAATAPPPAATASVAPSGAPKASASGASSAKPR